jgi:hypothetical protein
LIELRSQLAAKFGAAPPAGYVQGKSDLRAAVVHLLGCSELEAEQLVDTMEARGVIRYQGDAQEQVDRLEQHWSLD